MLNLLYSYLIEQEANVSMAVVVLFPVLFYLPKFFEYQYQYEYHPATREINCTDYALATLKASWHLCCKLPNDTVVFRP